MCLENGAGGGLKADSEFLRSAYINWAIAVGALLLPRAAKPEIRNRAQTKTVASCCSFRVRL